MNTGNTKQTKSKNNAKSSNNKEKLIEALSPLCNDVDWMQDVIDLIKTTPIPENDFEISGLARKISYELIEENPELFTHQNIKTESLKELIIQCLSNVAITKKRKENIVKTVEEVYNRGYKDSSVVKKRSKP